MKTGEKYERELYEPILSMHELDEKSFSLNRKKANTAGWQLYLLGILAGLYISIGGYGYLAAQAAGVGRAVASVVFCTGLIMVLIAGAELFTGNVMMITGLFNGTYSPFKVLKNWTIVYAANLTGSLLAVLLIINSGMMFSPEGISKIGRIAVEVAHVKMSYSFSQATILGFFCNILVIIAIIMATTVKDGISKILCIIFPISLFVLCGFEHSVANMFLIPLGLLIDGAAPSELLQASKNILPVTLGNILGGVFILGIHPLRLRQVSHLISHKKSYGNGQKAEFRLHGFS
ncbi:MAG: formate/nitrite transporter family protein [Candidatus Electrothrix sp. YB6]